ncbi:uncharacterized protein TNCV_485371 [Trichonephila clavipes]|nr:uncharacterized protein TNCV_485371 [Trichonephila clavipes]
MAALVSEYTLEFFTLLNARGKKELIEWCMKEGLIASSYECPKCNEQMGLNERKSVVLDGFEWRCRKKVHRATSLLVRLVEEEERWEIPDHPQNWGGIETNRTVTCMMLKADENDRRKSSPLPSMNFVALDLMLISVTVDQVA